MLRSLTAAAALAVMSLHAAFGCCWHHAHGCCASAATSRPAIGCGHSHERCDHERCDCGDGGHDHGADPERPTDDGRDDECSSDRCRFVTADGVEVPAAPAAQAWAAPEDAPSAVPVAAALRNVALGRANGPTGRPAHPVRALSRLCVWRI